MMCLILNLPLRIAYGTGSIDREEESEEECFQRVISGKKLWENFSFSG